jgi:hypothetical protein
MTLRLFLSSAPSSTASGPIQPQPQQQQQQQHQRPRLEHTRTKVRHLERDSPFSTTSSDSFRAAGEEHQPSYSSNNNNSEQGGDVDENAKARHHAIQPFRRPRRR